MQNPQSHNPPPRTIVVRETHWKLLKLIRLALLNVYSPVDYASGTTVASFPAAYQGKLRLSDICVEAGLIGAADVPLKSALDEDWFGTYGQNQWRGFVDGRPFEVLAMRAFERALSRRVGALAMRPPYAIADWKWPGLTPPGGTFAQKIQAPLSDLSGSAQMRVYWASVIPGGTFEAIEKGGDILLLTPFRT